MKKLNIERSMKTIKLSKANPKVETAIAKFKCALDKVFGISVHTRVSCDKKYLDVWVSVKGRDWTQIEPTVLALAKASNFSKYYSDTGSGMGFGIRDISFTRKG